MSDADAAYAAAREEIRRAKGDGATTLSLYADEYRALETIPPEIAALSSLTEIFLVNTQIADLAPLQALTSLRTLWLINTQVADLAPLQALTSLRDLRFNNTQVADLAPLQALTSLLRLELDNTQVADLAPLQALTGLQELSFDNTQIADLAPLQTLTGLRQLSFNNTHVADLTPLQARTSLHELSFRNTQVADLAPLRALTSLRRLELGNTQVVNLTQLQTLASLQFLSVSNTQVVDLAPLETLTSLQDLWLNRTRVADLTPLQVLSSLHRLSLGHTRVADLAPLQNLTKLRTLWLNETRFLMDLRPISELTSLLPGPDDPRGGGLHFSGSAACKVDPVGLGKLAEIEDDRERTERTLAYLRDLTVWPPAQSDAIERAMQGPILDASIADIALVEAHFEAVSPDSPLPRERDADYVDLVETLAYAADRLAQPGREDRFGLALIAGFRDYRRRVRQDQPNGRLLNFIADSVRSALSDDVDAAALDGFDRGQLAGFLEAHDAFICAYFPRALRPVTPEPDLSAESLANDLPPMVRDAENAIEEGIKSGVFGESLRAPLAYLKARMESALKTIATTADSVRASAALSELRKTATLVTAWVGRIKGRVLQYTEASKKWAMENPVSAARNTVFAVGSVGVVLAYIGPIFNALWRFIGNIPLPF
jgi:Leucine-rich repeat (LRR) protein